MRCTHCGAEFPDDQVVCPVCGAEVQIVPDYNPLEDVLTREVKGSVEGATRQIQTDDIRSYRRADMNQNVNSTRVLSREEMNRIRDGRGGRASRTAEQPSRPSGTGNVRRTGELRRQRQQKRLEAAKRKRRNLLITMFVILAIIIAGIVLIYQNSYTSMINKGYRSIQSGDYTAAENYFQRAISKDESRPDAYTGNAQIYVEQDDLEGAENVFLSAIETQPTNAELYQAAIDFYMETEQPGKVSVLLNNCEDRGVLNAVSEYVSAAPSLSPEEGKYSEVQEITITSETGGEIYYTMDGTEPTAATGTRYTEPVLLQDEREIQIRAIAVNENGIPSVVSSATYTIEFPIENAPAVTPSTGQYTEPTQITITVPDGYTAYYTMDGSTPDPSSSSTSQYTGPVDMPEGTRTIFNAILVNNQNGKATEATTRNYITTSE
nr:chitobiase/beta-hexosaminidase C-terminal domain-containing protein [uncultured Mediterraneibacter sp.]